MRLSGPTDLQKAGLLKARGSPARPRPPPPQLGGSRGLRSSPQAAHEVEDPALATARPPDPRAKEGALFRAVHDDGDEEDLEEEEAREALADYQQLLRLGRDGAKRG